MDIVLERPDRLDVTNGSRLHFARGQFSIVEADQLNLRPEISLFGIPLADSTLRGAAKAIVSRAARGIPATYLFINAHSINLMRTNRQLSRALSVADALLPDGSGIRLAARLAGVTTPPNLNGTDLFPELCREAARSGQSIYLLGGEAGIAQACAAKMTELVPGLEIAGTHHGFWHADDEDALIARINASGATLLLVGLGAPRQELWIARNRHRLTVPVAMGVGGLFDYYAGKIPRAPGWMRRIGCEWIWRFLQEPKRLANRYLLGNPVFIWSAIRHAMSHRGISGVASRLAKRGLDIAVAALTLTIFAPLIVAISVAIKLEDRGSVYFRQTRIGADGKPFKMWKFRSMVVDAEQRRAALLALSERDSVCFKMKRDPRITRVGSFLRRASLDELPQMFNVLFGDMSIVGPRPALPQEVIAYRPSERARLAGLPGITGLWQVSGRAEIPFKRQVALDVKYLRRRSIAGDIKLMFQTVPAVLAGRGAY